MNPFQKYQDMKPKILADEQFMDSLNFFAFTDRLKLLESDKVTPLGGGRHNLHCRIGQVNGVWLVTREYKGDMYDYPEDPMQHCENYIAAVVRNYEQGRRVPNICGGVRANNYHGGRYFLLLEDLTEGGTSDFEPAPKSGAVTGRLNGEEIDHDFDTDLPFHPPTKYLAEDKLIILDR